MMRKVYLSFLILTVILFWGVLAGCSSQGEALPQATQEMTLPTGSPEMPTVTYTVTDLPATATNTPAAATETSTPEPTASSTPLPSETSTAPPTITSTPTQTEQPFVLGTGIKSVPNGTLIYFIQRDAGGTLCGTDRALGFRGSFPMSGDIAKDIKGALKDLFSYGSEWIGGVYNPLYRSKIRVQSVEFDAGLVTVNLTGTYIPPDDPCDNELVRAQVWSTVRQFPEVKATNIYLGRVPFGDLVSNDR